MAITDNLVLRIKPQAGDSAIKDLISGSLFSGSAATLVDRSGAGTDYVWQIAGGDMTLTMPSPHTIVPATPDSGVALAVTLKVPTLPTSDLTRYVSFCDSTLANGLRLAMNGAGTGNVMARYGDGSSLATATGGALNSVASTEHTIMMRLRMVSGSVAVDAWVSTTGRVGTAADVVSNIPAATSYALTTALLRGAANDIVQIKDVCLWYREPTDAECAAVADNLRGTLDGAGSGTTVNLTGSNSTQANTSSTGAATVTPADSGSASGVTVSTKPLAPFDGVAWVTLAIPNALVLGLDRTVKLSLSNLTTDSSGKLTVNDTTGALVSGTDYMMAYFNADGSMRGLAKVTAV